MRIIRVSRRTLQRRGSERTLRAEREIAMETWLKLLLSMFIPAVVMFFFPREVRIYFGLAAGVIAVLAVVSLLRQEHGKKSKPPDEEQ
jgi:hypothetical protein